MKTASKLPSQKELNLIEQQSRLRGQIIGAYSQCEFLLLDVAMQARIIREYWNLGFSYHRKLENRITQAEALIAAPGPLLKDQERVGSLIERLKPFRSFRDQFAHAFCRIHHRDGAAWFIYKMWRMDDGEANRVEIVFSREELEELEQSI